MFNIMQQSDNKHRATQGAGGRQWATLSNSKHTYKKRKQKHDKRRSKMHHSPPDAIFVSARTCIHPCCAGLRFLKQSLRCRTYVRMLRGQAHRSDIRRARVQWCIHIDDIMSVQHTIWLKCHDAANTFMERPCLEAGFPAPKCRYPARQRNYVLVCDYLTYCLVGNYILMYMQYNTQVWHINTPSASYCITRIKGCNVV